MVVIICIMKTLLEHSGIHIYNSNSFKLIFYFYYICVCLLNWVNKISTDTLLLPQSL